MSHIHYKLIDEPPTCFAYKIIIQLQYVVELTKTYNSICQTNKSIKPMKK